jgi:membrane protein YqaA with SNARE-associated domain
VDWNHVRLWLKTIVPALGGFGLLLSAFIDSSFVPLPLVTDLVLMELCIRHPLRTPYYSGIAAIGSLAGCIWIYWLARKGGQAYYRKTQGHAPGRIRRFIREYPMACVFLPAIAPFPVPFKPFVIAQGVFQVPFVTVVWGTLLGRGLLFFCEGFLAARYGAAAKDYLLNQPWAMVALALVLVVVFLVIRRLPELRRMEYSQTD